MSNVGGRRWKVNPQYGVDASESGMLDFRRGPPVSQKQALN
jgi:hypothetical protein